MGRYEEEVDWRGARPNDHRGGAINYPEAAHNERLLGSTQPTRPPEPINATLAGVEKLMHCMTSELIAIECSLFGASPRITDDAVKSRPDEDYPTSDRAEMLRGFAQALASRLASIRERL